VLFRSKLAIQELQEYFAGERKIFGIQTKFLTGTEFEREVWTELRQIPYGKTISYKELAVNVGKPCAFRAVGNANSKNPMPIIIPCHRVIKTDGSLGGFSCGIEIKRLLLGMESKGN
jgi:methylated-DNA-[protein]-cysteine S-methyltransferase